MHSTEWYARMDGTEWGQSKEKKLAEFGGLRGWDIVRMNTNSSGKKLDNWWEIE